MRLSHGRLLWRSDGSFNVLRYAGHARHDAPRAGDGGNPVAVAEEKLNRDAEVLPGIGNGNAAVFMLILR